MRTTSLYLYVFRALALLLVLASLSCTSGPLVVEEDLEPSELIQRAQEASDKGRFKVAIQYYELILERYPDDFYSRSAARYEIAFIQYKKKDYELAKQGFQELLADYEGPDAELLPAQFKVLSEKVLAKILSAAK